MHYMADMANKTDTLQMRASPIWRKRIADWRREQTDLPSEAEAIRRLTEIALDLEAKKKKDKVAS